MTRKLLFGFILLFIVGLAYILFFRPSKTENPKAAGKPLNVIVIDICTLRADHLSSNGYSRLTSPNLDKFAGESVNFVNSWTSSGWCLPNFGGILTGTRPEVNKLLLPASSKLPDSLKTLPEVLRGAGYETAGFSGSRYLTDQYGLKRGFDTFVNPYMPGSVMAAMPFSENKEKTLEWLDKRKSSVKPFFLYLTIDDLHSPYHSDDPKKFDQGYSGLLDSIPFDMSKVSDQDVAGLFFDRIYNGEKLGNPPQKVIDDVRKFKEDPKNLEHLIARYDASLNYVDRQVGEILDKIKSDGLWDSTVIIITGHQGELLGEHGLLGHLGTIYEPILRVPLMVYFPGEKPKKVQELAERTDIPATILDAAKVLEGNKGQFEGNSLLPVIKGSQIDWKKYIFASSKPTRIPNDSNPDVEEVAVRNDQYKLIWYGYQASQYELYDLKADPKETSNLAGTMPDVFGELRAQIDGFEAKFK